MKMTEQLNQFINARVYDARIDFDSEMSMEENKDYRKGFRAGVLFSYLRMKADIGDLDAAVKQSLD